MGNLLLVTISVIPPWFGKYLIDASGNLLPVRDDGSNGADPAGIDHAARVELLLFESARDESADECFQPAFRVIAEARELQSGVIDRQAVGTAGKPLEFRSNDSALG